MHIEEINMNNAQKIAKEILASNPTTGKWRYPEGHSAITIPIHVQYFDNVPRISVDLDQISYSLEKVFHAKERRTEITQGTGNIIFFDLEPKE
jgi:hypothetical protein